MNIAKVEGRCSSKFYMYFETLGGVHIFGGCFCLISVAHNYEGSSNGFLPIVIPGCNTCVLSLQCPIFIPHQLLFHILWQ